MKTLKELKSIKRLSRKEQEAIAGGKYPCYDANGKFICPKGYGCVDGVCDRGLE
jgi:hypothetical protein